MIFIILNKIYEIRTKQKLSLRELSKRSGVTFGSINMIENGVVIPSQTNMMRIAKGLNVPTHKVFMLDYTKVKLD